MSEGQWYYCLDHKTVEPYMACKSESRLGPYATPDEAANALEIVAERNKEWEEDPRFNDEDEDEADDDDYEGWGPFKH